MTLDSTLIAAVLLLGAALVAAVGGNGVYLRFAAMLSAALAIAVLAQAFLPGPHTLELAGVAALPVLPLAGVSLGLSAIARFLRPLPPLPATLLLLAALGGGVGALFGAGLFFALLPLLLGGLAATIAALHRAAVTGLLAGVLLMASACAFAGAGMTMPGLLLLAAALTGFSLQTRASKSSASLVWFVP
jgi:hypothetical protein